MPKIYLSPAYHKMNPCALPGCDETTHNNRYLDELEPFLDACGIEYKRGPRRTPGSNEDGTALMTAAIRESNAYNPDIHYVSHTNAFNGTVRGYRPMIYPGYPDAKRLADIIIRFRRRIYDQPVSMSYNSGLAELRDTVSTAYYEEHVFHDNYDDAKWFHDNMRNIARYTAMAFCEYLSIQFTDPYDNMTEDSDDGNNSEITVPDTPQPDEPQPDEPQPDAPESDKGMSLVKRIISALVRFIKAIFRR